MRSAEILPYLRASSFGVLCRLTLIRRDMFLSFVHTAFRASKREFFAAFFAFFVAFSVFLIVDSLSSAVVSQVEMEARPALGADVTANSNSPFSEIQETAAFEACAKFSADCSRKVSFSSTLFDSAGKTALVQIVGVEPGYPYYGDFAFVRSFPVFKDSETYPHVTKDVPSETGFLAESSVITRFASGGTIPFFGGKLKME